MMQQNPIHLKKEGHVASLELYHLFSLPCLVFWKDKEFIYRGYNHFGSQQLGFKTALEIIGKSDFDIFSHDTAVNLRSNDQTVIENAKQMFIIETAITKNNMTFIFYSRKIPLFDDHRQVTGLLGLVTTKQNNDCIKNQYSCSNCPHKVQYNEEILSKREHDCIQYLSCGFTIKQVAQRLQVSPRTVETYIERSKIKFNCHSKSELILAFLGEPRY